MQTKRFIPFATLVALATSCTPTAALPGDENASSLGELRGWFLSGPRQQSFRAATDTSVKHGGSGSGRLEATTLDPKGAATLMQSITADPYRGKRVRFAAWLKTMNVSGWTGAWLRVHRPYGKSTFDNMQDRPLRGSTDWVRSEVVLDVAPDALSIDFGLLQDGTGVSWIDDTSIESVGRDVKTSGFQRGTRLSDGSFERDESVAPWLVVGEAAGDFTARIDRAEKHAGEASLMFERGGRAHAGYGSLVQPIRAIEYEGKRIAVHAWVKGQNVARGSTFHAKTFSANASPDAAATEDACPLGDASWKPCRLVVDVPPAADILELGIDLRGSGTAWLDDLSVEVVGNDEPLTTADGRARGPSNGDFEASADGTTPAGWFRSGGGRAEVDAATDTSTKHGGKASARLRRNASEKPGYGTLMQSFRADDMRGARVRLRAFVKGTDVDGRADFWARVQASDSPTDGPGLGGGHADLHGTFDWKELAFVFDVPERASDLQLGLGLGKRGTLWMDDVRLEKVDESIPLTDPARGAHDHLEGGSFEAPLSPRWAMSGGGARHFSAVLDRERPYAGDASVRLEPNTPQPTGYGTFMTDIDARPWRGKRMKLSTHVRGSGIRARGDLWLRVQASDSPGDGPGLGGGVCVLNGDFDWKPCTIVFEVPSAGAAIQAGIGLGGPGKIWLDEVTLEEVGNDVPVTTHVRVLPLPQNLGLEP